MANLKTELENKQTNLKKIALNTNMLNANDVIDVLDKIDNRLSDFTVTEQTLGIDQSQLVQLIGKIIEKFGGTNELNTTQLTINITQDDIDNGLGTVSFITSPFIVDPTKPITIDWGDGSTDTVNV